jgi:hypothetical protein
MHGKGHKAHGKAFAVSFSQNRTAKATRQIFTRQRPFVVRFLLHARQRPFVVRQSPRTAK